jgi:hypothetical protein
MTMAKIPVDCHTTPCCDLQSPSSESYFLCLVEICLYVLHTNLLCSTYRQISTKHKKYLPEDGLSSPKYFGVV